MIEETMTREERMLTAVSLGIPDRTPVTPNVFQFAHHHKGVSPEGSAGGVPTNVNELIQAFHDTFDDLGGYDALDHAGYTLVPGTSWRTAGILNGMVPPQAGNVSLQYREEETITFEDYDKIINLGWNGFCEQFILKTTGASREELEARQQTVMEIFKKDKQYWDLRGVPIWPGSMAATPEFTLSLGRTLPKFIMDVRRHPDKVKAAMDAMVPDIIQSVIDNVKFTGISRVVIGSERSSGAYWDLDTFERLFFPLMKQIVEGAVDAGVICQLHLDTDYTSNLPYFKELPKGKCICEFDSTTDIFKAKEILKGHVCIRGDVPASLLTVGSPDDVTEYCMKLIDIVGKDGGFILCTGCECPVDAKFENVKAMIDTAKNYNPHKPMQ